MSSIPSLASVPAAIITITEETKEASVAPMPAALAAMPAAPVPLELAPVYGQDPIRTPTQIVLSGSREEGPTSCWDLVRACWAVSNETY